MTILITGAAGNLGSQLTRYLLPTKHQLKLLIHKRDVPQEIKRHPNVHIYRGDLQVPETLRAPCRDMDCIVHLAGVLFKPFPECFLYTTNFVYTKNIVDVTLAEGVRKFILISFPQVEGPTTPERPACGRLNCTTVSIHAQTRLLTERYLFDACNSHNMIPVSLRCGLIYGSDVLMVNAARWLLRYRFLAVWRRPTWVHLLSIDDFLECVKRAIENPNVHGIYLVADDSPIYLQAFLDMLALHCSYPKPWRLPNWCFFAAAWLCELFATAFKTTCPLHRDFIRIGMVSFACDTRRMRHELLPQLKYPTVYDGIRILSRLSP